MPNNFLAGFQVMDEYIRGRNQERRLRQQQERQQILDAREDEAYDALREQYGPAAAGRTQDTLVLGRAAREAENERRQRHEQAGMRIVQALRAAPPSIPADATPEQRSAILRANFGRTRQALSAIGFGADETAQLEDMYVQDPSIAETLYQSLQEPTQIDPLRQGFLDVQRGNLEIRRRQADPNYQEEVAEAQGFGRSIGTQRAETTGPVATRAREQFSNQANRAARSIMALAMGNNVVREGNTPLQNAWARAANTEFGQNVMRTLGTNAQSHRDTINSVVPNMIQDMRAASGMGARGLDSNRELDFYAQMFPQLSNSAESMLAALTAIDARYGDGTALAGVEIPPDIAARVAELSVDFQRQAQARLSPEERQAYEEWDAAGRPDWSAGRRRSRPAENGSRPRFQSLDDIRNALRRE